MEWIMSANKNKYNHKKAFEENGFIYWYVDRRYELDDTIYIYVTKPSQSIQYVAKVTETNVPLTKIKQYPNYWNNHQDYLNSLKKNNYFKIELIKILKNPITYSKLVNNGLAARIQGAIKLYDTNNNLYPWAQYLKNELAKEDLVTVHEQDSLDNIDVVSSPIDIDSFQYTNTLKHKPASIIKNGTKVYKRDRQVAINALAHAHFQCEYDSTHPTFIRKSDKKPYTEAHHLIPMSAQDDFLFSLDVEENIVSLCSHCHNEIHYGLNGDKILTKLYNERISYLKNKKIDLSLNQLLDYYK